jgi:hypothetical protein
MSPGITIRGHPPTHPRARTHGCRVDRACPAVRIEHPAGWASSVLVEQLPGVVQAALTFGAQVP